MLRITSSALFLLFYMLRWHNSFIILFTAVSVLWILMWDLNGICGCRLYLERPYSQYVLFSSIHFSGGCWDFILSSGMFPFCLSGFNFSLGGNLTGPIPIHSFELWYRILGCQVSMFGIRCGPFGGIHPFVSAFDIAFIVLFIFSSCTFLSPMSMLLWSGCGVYTRIMATRKAPSSRSRIIAHQFRKPGYCLSPPLGSRVSANREPYASIDFGRSNRP